MTDTMNAISKSIASRRVLPMTELTKAGGIALIVRAGDAGMWDRGIANEVQAEYFPDALRAIPFDAIIDVGAHIGSYTLFAHQSWPKARVVAIEMHPENYEILRLNCAAPISNQFDGATGDIQAFHGIATGEHTAYASRVQIAAALHNTGGHIVKYDDGTINTNEYELISAPALRLTLSDLLKRVPESKNALLKLDCEGTEIDLLPHVPDLKAIRAVVGEYHWPYEVIMDLFRTCFADWQVTIKPVTSAQGTFLLRRTDGGI